MLRSIGAAFRLAAFVSKGNDLGLLLNETAHKEPGKLARAPAAGDLIFDYAQRRLTGEPAGWKIATPALNGWRMERTTEAGWTIIQVWQGDRLLGKVRLKANQVITDFALLPPQPPLTVPILAIAARTKMVSRYSVCTTALQASGCAI